MMLNKGEDFFLNSILRLEVLYIVGLFYNFGSGTGVDKIGKDSSWTFKRGTWGGDGDWHNDGETT